MPDFKKKQEVIDEIKGKLDKAASAILVDARGLTVAQDTELRKRLRDGGVDYKVYKNTMMDFAMKDTPCDGLREYLKGPSALAICYEDETKAARIIDKTAKEFKLLELKAGIVENVVYNADQIKSIAEIPSREVLLSKLLGSLKSPMSSFARVVSQIAEKGGEAAAAAE